MKVIDKFIKSSNEGFPPKWCSHIYFWSMKSKWSIDDGIEYPPIGGWTFRLNKCTSSYLNATNWNFCPLCGIKKPKK